jgi:hypothetical protein
MAHQAGAQVCLVAIPSTVQVSRSHYDFYRRACFELDDRLLISTTPQDRLAELCRRKRAAFVDLLAPFRQAAAAGESLYWENDDHLSQAGHLLAFKVIDQQFLQTLPWTRTEADGNE